MPRLSHFKLDNVRVAPGKQWQERFGLSEAIPVTVVVDNGRVRIVHESVLPDPVTFLEPDSAALKGTSITGGGKQATEA